MLRFVIGYLDGFKIQFAMIILCAGITSAADLSMPYLTAKFVDEVLYTKNVERLHIFVFGLLGINLLAVASNYFFVIRSTAIQATLTKILLKDLIVRIQRLKSNFLLKTDMIYLSKRVDKDSNDLLQFVLGSAIDISIQSVMLIMAMTLLYSIGAKWLMLLLIVAIFHAGIFHVLRKQLFQISILVRETESRYFTNFSDNFLYVYSIKLHSLYEEFIIKFEESFNKYFNAAMKEAKFRFWFAYGRANETKLFTVLIFLLGGLDVLENEITVGNFIALNGYYAFAMQSVAYFMSLGQGYQNALAAYNRILDLNNTPLDVNGTIVLMDIHKVAVKNISYSVDGRKIFEKFSCEFVRGKIYCLVGKNGSGKTTLLNLICGMLQPASGVIEINGVAISAIDMVDARKNLIAVAEQQEFIKNDTLSGGERRGFSIEKTFAKNSALMILDEPDNNLDSDALNKLVAMIVDDKQTRITILISHDEKIITAADEIIHI